jgi:hypothetical protein
VELETLEKNLKKVVSLKQAQQFVGKLTHSTAVARHVLPHAKEISSQIAKLPTYVQNGKQLVQIRQPLTRINKTTQSLLKCTEGLGLPITDKSYRVYVDAS